MSDYIVEVLVDGDIVLGDVVGSATVEVIQPAPDANAYIEGFDFSRSGNLAVQVGQSEKPITGGTFIIASIAARVSTAPVGASIILDIKKNGTSIFTVSGNRPTILAGSKTAVVGSWSSVTLTTGDYISVDIVQVGSTSPGVNLVVPIRLCKIA